MLWLTARVIAISASSITGTFTQTLTLFVLRRLRRTLNSRLDLATYNLMTSLTVCDLLLCATGLPLFAWNTAVGDVWPFSKYPILCYYSRWLFSLSYTSHWHMATIAMLRFFAVFKPVAYARIVKERGVAQVLVVMVPWVFGNAWAFIGFFTNTYRYRNVLSENTCSNAPADPQSARSVALFLVYRWISTAYDVTLPILLGGILYTCTLYKLKRRSDGQKQQPNTNGAAATVSRNANIASVTQSNVRQASEPAVNGPRSAQTSKTTNGQRRQHLSLAAAGAAKKGAARRSYNAVKVLTLACLVDALIYGVGVILYTISIITSTPTWWPYVTFATRIMYYAAYCLATPLAYVVSSADMRAAYIDILWKAFGCLWCCAKRSVKKVQPTVAET